MIAKTTRSKAQRKFDMPTLRRRAKKLMRKRHKKTISLSEVNKIWKEYVEYAIIKQVLYRGIAEIDNNFSVELVGKKYPPRLLKLLEKGWQVGKTGIKPAELWNRMGYIYKLRVVDKQCKGQIVFEADPKFKKRVVDKLKNTTQYYRIEQ